MKNSSNPIEPATFRLVAQCVNCATAYPTHWKELLKHKRKKSHCYLLGGLPWNNGCNVGYIPFAVVFNASLCGMKCVWVNEYRVGKVHRPSHPENFIHNNHLTHGQQGRRSAQRLHVPKHCDLISVTEINLTWQKCCLPSLTTSQMRPSVELTHIRPVITSHYARLSSLENVRRLVSFITGQVVQHTYVLTYMHNYVIVRSFMKKKRFPTYLYP